MQARLDEGDPRRFPGALKETEAAFNVQEELSEFGFEGLERRSRSSHVVQTKRQKLMMLPFPGARHDLTMRKQFPGALRETEAAFNVQEELSEFGFEGRAATLTIFTLGPGETSRAS